MTLTSVFPPPTVRHAPVKVCDFAEIRKEEVDLSDYDDYHDAYRQIGQFLEDVYMHKRVHSRLGYLTPAEFESQYRLASTPSTEVVFI